MMGTESEGDDPGRSSNGLFHWHGEFPPSSHDDNPLIRAGHFLQASCSDDIRANAVASQATPVSLR
jgi:hypothetical protein